MSNIQYIGYVSALGILYFSHTGFVCVEIISYNSFNPAYFEECIHSFDVAFLLCYPIA